MSSFNYTEAEAGEEDAKYLILQQIAKDVNLRLSDPLEVAQGQSFHNLLAVSNPRGLAFAATKDGFLLLQLSTLRSFFKAAARNTSPRISEPLRSIETTAGLIASRVTFVKVGNSDSTIVVGFENGAVAAWVIESLTSGSKLGPIFVLQPPSPGLKLLDLSPNPSDRPELCVALYAQPGAPGIDAGTAIVLDITKGSWGAQLSAAGGRVSSLCWSVKGKQIVLGLESGELLQITPEGDAKDRIAKPFSLEGSYHVVDIKWLENHVFVVTYNQAATSEEEPEHSYQIYSILRDVKASQITFAKFPIDPAPPYGDTSRKSNRYAAWLKGWEPAKHLVFVGSSPSTDVGLLGCSSEGSGPSAWSTMELEETSRPILPFSSFDKSSDTAPVGLELDLTATEDIDDPNAAARGDDKTKLPAVPVLLVYTSDGVLLAYNVINTHGGPFPNMVTSDPAASQSAVALASTLAAPAAKPQDTKPAATAFGQPSTPSTPSVFGQTSTTSSATPAFGQSSGFGKASAFGSAASTPAASSTFGTSSNSGGFGAFGSAGSKPSAFGSTGFGFGFTTSATSSPSTPAASSPAPAFGSTPTKSAFGQSAAFGQTAKQAFGSSSGFGTSPVSAFGSSAPSTPAAQKDAAGSTASAFGGFSSSSSGGAFGGFASKGASAFGSASAPSSSGSVFGSGGKLETAKTDAKPFGSVFGSASPSTGSVFTSSTSAFDKGGFSAFAANKGPDDSSKASDKDEPASAGGSFSFGGLDSMLGDNKADETKDQAKAVEEMKDDISTATMPDSGVDTAISTPKTQEPAFSFQTAAPEKSSPISFKTTDAIAEKSESPSSPASKPSSPPAKSPAFSSFQPGFGAGSNFGNQLFSFGNGNDNGNGQPKSLSAFGKPAEQEKEVEAPQNAKKDEALIISNVESEKDQAEPAEQQKEVEKMDEPEKPKSAFSFAPKPAEAEQKEEPKRTLAFSFSPKPATAADEKKEEPESAFSFATKPADASKPAFSFALKPKEEEKKADEAPKPVADEETSKGLETTTRSAFSFATQPDAETKEESKSAFSFAQMPASEDEKKPAVGAAAAPKSAFGFATKPVKASQQDAASSKAAFSFAPRQPAAATGGFSFGSAVEKKNEQASGSTTPPESPQKPTSPSPFSLATSAAQEKPIEPVTEAPKDKQESPSPPDLSKPAAQPSFAGFSKPAAPAEAKGESAKSSFPSFSGFGQTTGGVFSFDNNKSGGEKPAAPASTASLSPPADQSTRAKPQGFFGFNSRAPRSSSPLTGAPVTSSDLSPSPEKKSILPLSTPSNEPKPLFDFNKFAPKPAASSPLNQPSFAGFGSTQPKPQQQQQQPAVQKGAPFSFSQPLSSGAAPAAGGFGKLSAPSGNSPFGAARAAAASPVSPSASPLPPPVSTAPSTTAPQTVSRGASPLVSGQTPQLGSVSSTLDPSEVPEKGIQGEFLKAYLILTKELGVLRSNVNQCAAFLAQLRQPTDLSHTTADFADPSKWSFGDLQKMVQLAQSLETDTGKFEAQSTAHKCQLTELQSMQLKAEAKREEVARFIRARSDPEFAKMVRVRQLGPEHVENQNKLRKTTALVRERMQELDEYLALLKNRLTNEKLGRTTMKAPTLDSVARATRNITAMASDRILELDHLALELDMLKSRSGSVRRQGSRSASVSSRFSPFDSVGSLADSLPMAGSVVAPVTSASKAASVALKAERIKKEAKDIFIAARNEPLLNRSAVPSEQARRRPTKAFESSDLQIAFAKGPVHLSQRPSSASPAPAPSLPAAAPAPKPFSMRAPAQIFGQSPSPQPAAASAPSFAPAKPSSGFGSSMTPLNFGKPSSTAIFDLPYEEKPFSPGGRAESTSPSSSRSHHSSKSKPRSSIAVALPNASGSSTVSNFFAAPPSGSTSPAPASTFPGFGGAKQDTLTSNPFGSFKSSSPAPAPAKFSFSDQPSGFSFAPPNHQEPVTFDGLQQPKPVSFASNHPAESEEEDYEDEDDYEEDGEDYEEEGLDEEGLSDVEEEEEDGTE